MYARGEVTREQLSAYADEGRQIPRQPEQSAVGPADVLEDWWQTTQARIRRNLLNTTLTEAEAAAVMQISIDDVGELFESNRLLSFDLEGEERIPDWQLVRADDGGPATLLPGLDVLYAAAPQPLLDAAAMTEFMTTPHTFLTINEEPMTRLTWLEHGRPLATIIALFRGRQGRS
ncbi:MAG: hypothetical protein V4755_18535 [Curtobacterium sp.]